MNNEKIQNICKLLDFLGKKEHIFFMSENEYKKEFNGFLQKKRSVICQAASVWERLCKAVSPAQIRRR